MNACARLSDESRRDSDWYRAARQPARLRFVLGVQEYSLELAEHRVAMPAMATRAPTADSACEHVARGLWDYVDGRLSPSTLAEFEAHLAECNGCPKFVSFARLMHRVLRTLGARTATDETSSDGAAR